jgi:putative membrane protein
VALVLVVWFIVNQFNKNKQHTNNTDETPLDILKKRYAKGEITKDHFEEMKKELS